jgi:phage tail tape-measure protein
MTKASKKDRDLNPDPLTGEPGSHPVGTGVGATGGAVTGVAIGGAIGGPVGAAVGGVVGTMAGAAAGHKTAEAINPTVEDAYWRENYKTREYVDRARPYDYYEPAYRYGWESRARMGKRSYNEVERDLERGWDKAKGESKLAWNDAKNATRDAWHRVERAVPGDFDRDGR